MKRPSKVWFGLGLVCALGGLILPLACQPGSLLPLRLCKEGGDCKSGEACKSGICVKAEGEEVAHEGDAAATIPEDSDEFLQGESLAQEASIEEDGGSQGRKEGIFPDRVRESFLPEKLPVPDSRKDRPDSARIHLPDDPKRPEELGREAQERPPLPPEEPPTERPSVPDLRDDAASKGCQEGQTRRCYPAGKAGCRLPQGVCFGVCSFGTQTCSGGAWGGCQGAVTPTGRPECDGKDYDCDGVINDHGRCP